MRPPQRGTAQAFADIARTLQATDTVTCIYALLDSSPRPCRG